MHHKISLAQLETHTPTNPDQVFSLQKLNSLEEGSVYQSQFSGTGTYQEQSTNITGSVSIANRKQEMLDNELVTPKDMMLNVNVNDNITNGISTRYYNADGYIVKTVNNSAPPLVCTPTSSEKFPDSVKIDEFGYLPSFTCSDDQTQTGTWRTEGGESGHLLFIEHVVYKDAYTQDTSTEETIYTLDASGNIISMDFLVNFDGVVLKIKSK